jgi:predicted nucleic acid-binding protein
MSLVLDCSVTIAWVHGDETTKAVEAVFDTVASQGAWVPALWRLEVANVLEMGVRRNRHDDAFRDATLADLALLPIKLDPETEQHAWGETARLAAHHRLTLYDAAYLELARRRELALATLDQELRAAADAEGVPVLGVNARSGGAA